MLLPHISLRGQLGRHALLTGWSNSSCGAAVHQPKWNRGTLEVQVSSGAATEKAVEAKPSAPSHALRAKRRRPCPAPDRPDERSPAQEEEVSNRALNMLVRVRTCFVATLSGSPGAALAICSSPNGQQQPFCSPDLCPSPRWCGSLASTKQFTSGSTCCTQHAHGGGLPPIWFDCIVVNDMRHGKAAMLHVTSLGEASSSQSL